MGEGARRDARRRLTVDQAADQLGVSVDAVRTRIKRGTIGHEREGGRVYVLLDADQYTDQYTDQSADQERDQRSSHTAELIRTLQEELAAERQAHAESRRLLAAALERIPPQIEPPSEPPGASETATPQPGRVETQPAVESTQEPREASEMHMPEVHGGPQPHPERPWWRRIFRG